MLKQMKKIIGFLILKLGGWKDDYPKDFDSKKSIFISAPHTSIKDYLFSIASFWKQGLDVFIVHENEQISILKCFFKKILGRKSCFLSEEGVAFSVNLLNNSDKLILAFSTESTSGKTKIWRTEFYEVAQKTNVPIAIGYLDYSDKIMGVSQLFTITGNKKRDLEKISKFYNNFTPRYPNKYKTIVF